MEQTFDRMNLTAAPRQVRRAKYVFLILRYTLTGAKKYQTSKSFEAARENDSARGKHACFYFVHVRVKLSSTV